MQHGTYAAYSWQENLQNVEREMNRLNIDILGLSEVRWPGAGKTKTNGGYIYFSGGTDNNHRYGTAILITDEIEKAVLDYVPLSDRVMLLKLQTSHRIMNILQVYAPTNDKSDTEIEEFYNKVDELLKLTRKGEITIVMGDLNAKIGTGAEGESVGAYGLGERNPSGDRLVQFCNENNLYISNTFF